MIRLKHFLGLVALSGFVVACSGTTGQPARIAADRLPDGWDAAALEALVRNLDVIKTVENEIDVQVLKWKVEENDLPQRTETALIWAKFRAGEAEDWMLAQVIRATGGNGVPSPWSLAVWKGTPQVSHEYYKQAPGEAEITRFLRSTWWSDEATSGNRLVDSAVRTQTWTKVLGAPPPELGG